MRALVAGAFALTAAGAAAEELTMAHFMSPNHVMHTAVMAPLAERVAAETDGDLAITIHPAGELGAGPQQQYMRAVQGVADIAFGLQGYASSQFPKTMLVELPGLAEDPRQATEMLWRAFEPHLADEYVGTHVLGVWTNEPNVLMTRDRAVRSLDDLEGMKIRVPGAVMGRAMEALGATPVQMPAPKMYTALQTGVVDGLLVGPCVIDNFKIGEVANHFTVGAPLGVATFFLAMNEGSWEGLSDAQKQALSANAGREMSLAAAEAYGDCGAEQIEAMRQAEGKEVIELPEAELDRLRAALDETRAEIVAELEAEGVPAGEIIATMRGGS